MKRSTILLKKALKIAEEISSEKNLEAGESELTPMQKFRAGEKDLRGLDLTGANLKGVDFTGAILTNANLSYAELIRAKLGGAKLIRAKLSGADLTGAILPEGFSRQASRLRRRY